MSFLLRVLTLISLIESPSMAASSWVLGEGYVALNSLNQGVQLIHGLRPKSWALDSKLCRLWVEDEITRQLWKIDTDGSAEPVTTGARIISDLRDGRWLTLLGTQTIQERDASGLVLNSWKVDWANGVKRIHLLGNAQSLVLNHIESSNRKSELSVLRFDKEWNKIQTYLVESQAELWGGFDFQVDESRQNLWLGYAKTTPSHVYSPQVGHFDLNGTAKTIKSFNERGLFFGSCLSPEGTYLMARDIPSAQFTVPVYSFLEKFIAGGQSSTALNLETNLLVDALACDSEAVSIASHSILNASKTELITWDWNLSHSPQRIADLPAKANHIYHCGN